MADPIEVGKEVLAYCGKCKMDLAAIIVAMKGDKIARVECKTCEKSRAFKAPKGITTPPPKKVRKSKKAENEAKSLEMEWGKLMEAQKSVDATPYGMKVNFILGQKLTHGKFGEGVVSKMIYPNKVEVMFKTEFRILIHGGAESVVPNIQ